MLLGIDGDITFGQLVAFLFLITLFVGPVQVGTEVLNQAQNAVAGWRRVIGVIDTPADVADPGPDGVVLPRGPIDVRFEHVSFGYPNGPRVLHDVNVTVPPQSRIAVVGETGSGKTTFAKLLTRLMDPSEGRVDRRRCRSSRRAVQLAAGADRDGARRTASCSTRRCWTTSATAGRRRPRPTSSWR